MQLLTTTLSVKQPAQKIRILAGFRCEWRPAVFRTELISSFSSVVRISVPTEGKQWIWVQPPDCTAATAFRVSRPQPVWVQASTIHLRALTEGFHEFFFFFLLITSQDLSANIPVGSSEVRARVPNFIKNQGLFSADRINNLKRKLLD